MVTFTKIVTSVAGIIIKVVLNKRLKLCVLVSAKAHHPVAGQGVKGKKNAAVGASARHWDIFRVFLLPWKTNRVVCIDFELRAQKDFSRKQWNQKLIFSRYISE